MVCIELIVLDVIRDMLTDFPISETEIQEAFWKQRTFETHFETCAIPSTENKIFLIGNTSRDLTLQKIANRMSKNCQKLDNFFKN